MKKKYCGGCVYQAISVILFFFLIMTKQGGEGWVGLRWNKLYLKNWEKYQFYHPPSPPPFKKKASHTDLHLLTPQKSFLWNSPFGYPCFDWLSFTLGCTSEVSASKKSYWRVQCFKDLLFTSVIYEKRTTFSTKKEIKLIVC